MGIEGRADIHYRYYYILLFLVFMEALFFLYYGLSRHNNYLSSFNDLGHYDRIIYGFSEGRPFRYTGQHFEPVLAVFVPFYFIMPSVNWLIFAQSLALPFASLPIYFLALNITQSGSTALMWAAIYLINPFVLSAASNDFHPVFLAVPFISLAYLSLEEKKSVKLLLSCIFILLCKEHFGLLLMGFGFLWYLKYRDLKISFSLLILGGSYFLLVMKVLIPFFSTLDEHSMIVGQVSRYGWLGQSLESIFIRIFTDSAEIIRYVLFSMGGDEYLLLLFLPLLFLPIFGCAMLLPGLGDLAANLLSANPMPRSIISYHTVTLIPVFVVSAIYGARRLSLKFKISLQKTILISLLLSLFISCLYFPFFNLPGRNSVWAPKRLDYSLDANYIKIKTLLKPELSLSVQANIGAHFTQRQKIFMFPNKVGDVDAVVLRLDSPTLRTKKESQYLIGSLGNHLQMSTVEYLDTIESLLESDVYQKKVWADPWLVFMKGERTTTGNDEIIYKINNLKAKWE